MAFKNNAYAGFKELKALRYKLELALKWQKHYENKLRERQELVQYYLHLIDKFELEHNLK